MTVTLSRAADAVTVAVRDDGAGIDPADMPHLFERGYKGKKGHFGLGLAIAQAAADRAGWRLDAANAPEGGAVFTLTIPMAD